MEHIILLHGAVGDKEQFAKSVILDLVEHTVHGLNFCGHGGVAFPTGDFSIEGFAKEVIDFMNEHKIDRANMFGYSMGGYVGMYFAVHYPDKINRLITLGTKFKWDAVVAEKEVQLLNAEKIAKKLPAFAAVLQKRHAPNDWKIVLKKTADMLIAMGNNNPIKMEEYSQIRQPVLLMLGDRDKMVSLEETLAIYHQLPNAQLSILPNTPHPIEMVNAERLVFEIRSLIK